MIISETHLAGDGKKVYQLDIIAKASSERDAEELQYRDFKAVLSIDGKEVCDLSILLDEMGLLEGVIDRVDWVERYASLRYPEPDYTLDRQ